MTRLSLLALTLSALLGAPALAQDSRPTSQPTSKPAKPKLPALGAPAGKFGAALTLTKPVSLDTVAEEPQAYAGKDILVSGKIKDVCRKKGCWMVIQYGKQEVRVRFKDYGFFVPRDAHGRRMLLQGQASVKTISVEELRHYAEESGNPEQAQEITEPETQITILATGVEILGSEDLPKQAKAEPAAAQRTLAAAQQGEQVGAKAKVTSFEAALAALRELPAARTHEFTHCAEIEGWYVFGLAGKPFAHGFAVQKGAEPGEIRKF